jgi:hypothetical protein
MCYYLSMGFRFCALLLLLWPVRAQTTTRNGSFAHIAVGYFDVSSQRGTWTTSLVFVNVSAATAPVQLNFYSNAGSALSLPITGVGPQSSYAFSVPANGTATIEFDSATIALTSGWAEVVSGTAVRGQGIYRSRVPGRTASEATVPLLQRDPSTCIIPLPTSSAAYPDALTLPFDNTSGYVSSVAFANTAAAAATLDIEFLDPSGATLHTVQQSLAARGHVAFETTTYSQLAGRKGTVRIRQSAASFSGIAFLFSPDGPFSTLLPIAR